MEQTRAIPCASTSPSSFTKKSYHSLSDIPPNPNNFLQNSPSRLYAKPVQSVSKNSSSQISSSSSNGFGIVAAVSIPVDREDSLNSVFAVNPNNLIHNEPINPNTVLGKRNASSLYFSSGYGTNPNNPVNPNNPNTNLNFTKGKTVSSPFGTNVSGSNSVVRNGVQPIVNQQNTQLNGSPNTSPIQTHQAKKQSTSPSSSFYSVIHRAVVPTPQCPPQSPYSASVHVGMAAMANYKEINNGKNNLAAAPIKGTKVTPKKGRPLQALSSPSTAKPPPKSAAVKKAIAAPKKATAPYAPRKNGSPKSGNTPVSNANVHRRDLDNFGGQDNGILKKPEVYVLQFALRSILMDAPPSFQQKLKFSLDFEDNLDLKKLLGKHNLPGFLVERSQMGYTTQTDPNNPEYIKKSIETAQVILIRPKLSNGNTLRKVLEGVVEGAVSMFVPPNFQSSETGRSLVEEFPPHSIISFSETQQLGWSWFVWIKSRDQSESIRNPFTLTVNQKHLDSFWTSLKDLNDYLFYQIHSHPTSNPFPSSILPETYLLNMAQRRTSIPKTDENMESIDKLRRNLRRMRDLISGIEGKDVGELRKLVEEQEQLVSRIPSSSKVEEIENDRSDPKRKLNTTFSPSSDHQTK